MSLRPLGLLLVATLLAGPLQAQVARDLPAELPRFDAAAERYVALALASNLALQGQDLELQNASLALAAARARFFPELSLNARYTVAQGGRQIDFPIGQLLNPAYQTLNQLLLAQGQPPRFGTLADQAFEFQRPREQDSHVSLRQPLYQPALPAAVTAQREYLSSQQFARLALARQLRRDVIVAYAGYLKSLRGAAIVRVADATLVENRRVTESLYANGRITQDQVLRARAEDLAAVQQLRETEDATRQALRYVNFLLNRPLETSLEEAGGGEAASPPALATPEAATARAAALIERAELAQLDALGRATEAQVRLARAALKPQLALGVDAGTQGEQYRLGSGYNYIAASLVLTWKFFDGGANRAAAAQARIAARELTVKRQDLAQRVSLEVEQAADRLQSAGALLATAQARESAAAETLRIAARKRDEGAISQLEFLDARNTLTSAQLNLNATRYELYARRAELDYATGTGNLPAPGTASQGMTP